MSDTHTAVPERIPALTPIYSKLSDYAETFMRIICGLVLSVHGFPKIMDPFRAIPMIEGLGFYPGLFWAPCLAATEFFGGILIAVGLFTRPAAVAATVVLLVTVYAHWIPMEQGYAGAEKSILWIGMTLFFAIRGSNNQSIDARLGRQF